MLRGYEGFKNMTLIVPPRTIKGYGVFHTKMWLIRFSTFLRIVICTANQHAQDWIVWLNAFWYKDFPIKGQTLA
jgi:tyrosyl-DNA phosphodiesterase 1